MFRVCSALWCLALGSLIVAGCQSSKLPPNARPTKPVTVTVMYKGAPVEGAGVTFTAETNPIAAYGMTDKSGKTPLKTYIEGDGAVIGKHKVTVSKMEVTGGGEASIDSPDYDPTSAGGPPPAPKSLIPAKYASSTTSTLTAEVTESGPNDITLELVD